MSYVDELTKEERDDIRREFSWGRITEVELAKRYGVAVQTINYIISRKYAIDKDD